MEIDTINLVDDRNEGSVVRKHTTGDGNCAFHAIFGCSDSFGAVRDKNAAQKRKIWADTLTALYKDCRENKRPLPAWFSHMMAASCEASRALRAELATKLGIDKLPTFDSVIYEHNPLEPGRVFFFQEEPNANLLSNQPEACELYLNHIALQSHYLHVEELRSVAHVFGIDIQVYSSCVPYGHRSSGLFKKDSLEELGTAPHHHNLACAHIFHSGVHYEQLVVEALDSSADEAELDNASDTTTSSDTTEYAEGASDGLLWQFKIAILSLFEKIKLVVREFIVNFLWLSLKHIFFKEAATATQCADEQLLNNAPDISKPHARMTL